MTSVPHRIQITLGDEDIAWLRGESERTGASIAALVRRAVRAERGGELTTEERLAILDRTAGAWADRAPGTPDPYDDLRRLRAGEPRA
jgi:hypothetical protein